LNAHCKRQISSDGLGTTHPVLGRMDESRLVNTPFAVGSMTERCCPEAIGLSVLVLVTPTLTLSSYPAFLVAYCRLLQIIWIS
jgi:hypothetical protein